ncbi:MAG: hypothetical protein R6U85_09140, partial [Salinivirgaceae bacterium]
SFASHSWWFQGPYYVGLEDDYDMGLKFDLNLVENLDLSVAYYRQAEPQGPASGGVNWGGPGAGRYSYDLTSGNTYSNDVYTHGNYEGDDYTGVDTTYNESLRELNQFNIRAAYHITENIELGGSFQVGQNYNDYLDSYEWSTAYAGHVVANFGNFNFKGEVVGYDYAAKGAEEIIEYDNGDVQNTIVNEYDLETVQMGAYGFNYGVAKKSMMYVAGLAYNIDVEWGPISNIQPYVDFTLIDKANKDFEDTYHLIPGFLVSAGPIYAYFDFAMGKNQPWLTDDFGVGLGQGRTYDMGADPDMDYYTEDPDLQGEPVPVDDLSWNTRFNINIGYYF